ncbi:pilus assembly protein TadC [Thioclava sp. SK-1]|uniref:type II secretion system F family protein n=1 Tax=Thioclava sp. SK-1 TaxID=1889770 RepID=UPI0008259CBC|nr:type II secretion system F family protein [Thioclava sp. SK-1]OCX65902.1 pilus assembly protein TadC [Thioclava sp. SK-1]
MQNNSIYQMLVETLGPMGPLLALAGMGLVLVLATLPVLLKKRADPLDKLHASRPGRTNAGATKPPAKKQELRHGSGSDKLEKYANFLEPKTQEEMSESKQWLGRAGYRSPTAVRTFHAIQAACGIGLLFVGVVYTLIYNSSHEVPLDSTLMIAAILLPGLAGYYAPKRYVAKRIEARTNEIQDGFPDALDMLLVCVEAGQSLDQGIIRVARELEASYPAMSEEFSMVAFEVKAGKDRATVLRNFGERTGVADVQSFVTVMIQSQQFGTSIADALRLYSADMRDKRIMRAEEAANKIPTKMTLGTMMFTLPPLLIILVGPSVHGMMENFKSIGM